MPFKLRDVEEATASLPATGGSITLTFGARAIRKPTALKACYVIDDEMPFRFSEPTDPDAPKTFMGGRQAVPMPPDGRFKSYSAQLEIEPDGDTSTVVGIGITIEVFEVDADGEALVDEEGMPIEPKTTAAVIPIMHDEQET